MIIEVTKDVSINSDNVSMIKITKEKTKYKVSFYFKFPIQHGLEDNEIWTDFYVDNLTKEKSQVIKNKFLNRGK